MIDASMIDASTIADTMIDASTIAGTIVRTIEMADVSRKSAAEKHDSPY